MDDAVARLCERHGRGISNAAVSLNLNLQALRQMSKQEALRAIALAGAVRQGRAWRPESVQVLDDDLNLVVSAMSSPATASAPSIAWSSPADDLPSTEVTEPELQEEEEEPQGHGQAQLEVQPHELHLPESPQHSAQAVQPGTVARSRSRAS